MGAEIESGSHQAALQQALDLLGYDDFRMNSRKPRERPLSWVGIGSYVEAQPTTRPLF